MFKRVMLKLSGEELAGNSNSTYDEYKIKKIAVQVQKIIDSNIQLGIIVGGGNIWRGRDSALGFDRCKSDQIGMLATIMNAVFISEVFAGEGIISSVMTPFEAGAFSERFSKTKALEYMNQSKVIIFAGGTGHPYFSTDTAVALRGAELNADCLLFAKHGVSCVHEDDPKTNPNAKKLEHISFDDIISNPKLKVIDKSAACICAESGASAIVFGMDEAENIYKAAIGERIGTIITISKEE